MVATDPYLDAGDEAWKLARKVALAELLALSDIVSLHTPPTDETRNMIDAPTLAAMKPGAMLINSARGGIVDEAALADALRRGHAGGAAIDVFANEPLSAGDGARFAGLDNVILTPHIAGVTQEANHRVSQVTAHNVMQVLLAKGVPGRMVQAPPATT